jgi:hypothetical protein
MAQRIQRNTFGYRDARGHLGKVGVYVAWDDAVAGSEAAGAGLVNAVRNAVTALTNGALASTTGLLGRIPVSGVYGTAATYLPAEDKLRLTMQASDGTLHSFNIPSPLVSAFEADQESALASAIATLVAALKAAPITSAFICTAAGATFSTSLGGILVRRKFQRKLTIYGKSSNLDEPEE